MLNYHILYIVQNLQFPARFAAIMSSKLFSLLFMHRVHLVMDCLIQLDDCCLFLFLKKLSKTFLAVLGLCCRSLWLWGCSLVAMCRLLIVMAPLVSEHRL